MEDRRRPDDEVTQEDDPSLDVLLEWECRIFLSLIHSRALCGFGSRVAEEARQRAAHLVSRGRDELAYWLISSVNDRLARAGSRSSVALPTSFLLPRPGNAERVESVEKSPERDA